MWRVDPLLSGEAITATASGQRLSKHFLAATNTHAKTELLLETAYISKGQSQMYGSSAPEAVKIEPEQVKLKNFHC
jgi:hypothetical protein